MTRRQRRGLAEEYTVTDLLLDSNGAVPLVWWALKPNYGDLLSPWLVEMMTGHPVVQADRSVPHYAVIGSIANLLTKDSIVWGSGSFGDEALHKLDPSADFRAVRGPLTRRRFMYREAEVPAVYGDPALLLPLYFAPRVKRQYEVGLVLRWSEHGRKRVQVGPGVKLIDLGRSDVEAVTREILSCKRIVSSSLHGLVIADAYGIPNAWLSSNNAGGDFKFFDYFIAVDKLRREQDFDLLTGSTVHSSDLVGRLKFDARRIKLDHRALLDSCPFMTPIRR
jgi:pyruvyltransferase